MGGGYNFIDLGCNTGYLACSLANKYGQNNIKGVMVDANPEMVKESNWHINKNSLINCKAILGIVGSKQENSAIFYLNKYNISSSAIPFEENYPLSIKNGIKEIIVPVLSIHSIIKYFNDELIDLLKIDIEGSEEQLLKGCDISVFQKFRYIILEWHKWACSFDELKSKLVYIDFDFVRIAMEDEICGLALFKNNKLN